ncbi:EamA family transporter [Hymenobacter metallicola]|nr:EamA family transporter [Hymenobacter metallicola]
MSPVSTVDKLSVVLAILFSVVLLGEKLTLSAGLGVALSILGTRVLIWG